jgi:hypothetical protein
MARHEMRHRHPCSSDRKRRSRHCQRRCRYEACARIGVSKSRVFRTAIAHFTKLQSHAVDDQMQLTCFRTWAAGLCFVLRCRTEVLVEPPVGGAPGLGLLAKLPPRKIFAQQRVSVQHEQPAVSRFTVSSFASCSRVKARLRCASLVPTSGSVRSGMAGTFHKALRQPASAGRSNSPSSRLTPKAYASKARSPPTMLRPWSRDR